MTPKRIAALVLLVLIGVPVGLLVWENMGTRVNVVFKLSSTMAWDLGPDGVPLPALLAISFLAGAVVAGVVATFSLLENGRRARTLARQVTALQDELEYNKRTAAKPAAVSAPSTPVPSTSAPAAADLPSEEPAPPAHDLDDLI